MISFKNIGKQGYLGNQIFQYAFLRTQAKRLGTKFYCPFWIGDMIFELNDKDERVAEFKPDLLYSEKEGGYHDDVKDIKDGTDISGFFQSDKFFNKEDAYKWFVFKKDIFSNIDKKYENIDFSNTTAIHIRLGDYLLPQNTFYVPRKFYFKNALELLDHKKTILVFSNDKILAEKYLKDIKGNLIFIEGNKDYEDLYLMSKCRNIICSSSSFSWWAAYLDKFEDKKIIVPKSWFLPLGGARNDDIFVDGWIKVKATRWYDCGPIKFFPNMARIFYRRIIRSARIIKNNGPKELIREFKKYLKITFKKN